MPFRTVESVTLVEDATEFEYIDGLFYATNRVGAVTLRRCYRPHTFIIAAENARRAIEQFYDEGRTAQVVAFRNR